MPASLPQVLIVGGGPAGLATALRLRTHGVPVTVCDAGPGGGSRLGDRLAAKSAGLLLQLGLDPSQLTQCSRTSDGLVSVWGAPAPNVTDAWSDPFGAACHVDRRRLECVLRENAVNAGARMLDDTRVLRATQRDDGAWNIVARSAGALTTQTATALVDAGGRSGCDPFGRPRISVAHDRLVVTAFLFSTPLRQPYCGWTLVEACPDGWWYSAPLPNGRSSAMFFTDRLGANRSSQGPHELARGTKATITLERLPSGNMQRPIRASASVAQAPAGCPSSCIPVGDSALSLDPLCGGGLHVALETAIAAADAIRDWHEGRFSALDEFRNRIQRSFAAHLRARSHVYAMERRWSERPFWRNRSTVASG
jgi:2-polyprenyl-6-methoxyphenol hydroxylase-like FAD-dependent oxidoreductase